jgi:GTP-binding protein
MIPVDSADIKKEYKILSNELKKYNPEMMDKSRMLAITKIDMLDEELIKQLKKDVPKGIDVVYISSVAQQGLEVLKDKLWDLLQ